MRRAFIGFLVGFCIYNSLFLSRVVLVAFSLRLEPSWTLKVVAWIWMAGVGSTLPAALFVAVLHGVVGAIDQPGRDDPPGERIRSLRLPLCLAILGTTMITSVAVCVVGPGANRAAREAAYEATTAAIARAGGVGFAGPSNLPRGSGEMGPFDLARKIAALRSQDHSGWAPSRSYSAALNRQVAVSLACLPMSLCALGLACLRRLLPLPVLWAFGAGAIVAYSFAARQVGGGQLGISALVIPWAVLGGIAVVGAILIVISRD